MRFLVTPSRILLVSMSVVISLMAACGSDDEESNSPGGTGGTTHSAGAAGSSTSGGTGGTSSGGTSGATTGGTAGSPSGGASGTGGTAGAAAGASGTGGAAGAAGGTGGTGTVLPGSSITAAPYNCACDGATNDSACIQAALDEHPSWSHRTLEFPAGSTCIAVGLNWKQPVGDAGNPYTLRGNGAILKAPDGHPVASGDWIIRLNDVQFVTLDDLDFDGNRGNRQPAEVPAHSITIYGGRDILLNNVDANDGVTDNLYVGPMNNADATTFPTRVTVVNPIMRRAYRNNISIINCDTCVITGDGKGENSTCQLTDAHGTPPQAGIDYEPNAGSAVPGIRNSRIEGCYIARNEGWCVLLNSKANSEGTVVRGNTLEDCRLEAPTCGAGIILGHKDAIIDDNVFKNFALKPGCRSLIDFSATGTSIDTATVFENNRIENITGLSANSRIVYIHSANSGGHVFRNNAMTNIGVDASGDWCSAGATPEPNEISDNRVDGAMQSPNPGCP